MTTVTFYLLQDHDARARCHFLVRLVAKLYQKGLSSCLFIQEQADFAAMDNALWTDEPTSFLAHDRYNPDKPLPIVLVDTLPEQVIAEVFFHLSFDLPVMLAYQHYIHVVLDREPDLTAARKQYKHYNQQGIAVRTYNIPNVSEHKEESYS